MSRSSIIPIVCAALCVVCYPASMANAGDWPFKASLNTQTFPASSNLKIAGNDVIGIGIHNDGSSGAIRSFNLFDLSSMPSTATVSAVTFKFHVHSTQGTLPTTIQLVRLDTTNVMDASVSWIKINSSSNWATGGGNIGAVMATLTPTWSNGAEYVFSSSNVFVTAVQDAIANQSGILQLLLYSPDHEVAHPTPQTTGGFIRMHARNSALPAMLTVTANVDQGGGQEGGDHPWFGVDYNASDNIQFGYIVGGTIVSGSISNTTADAFGDGRDFTSILTSSTGNMQERVRQNIGNTTSNALLKDLAFASGGDLTLTLRGLIDRQYEFTASFNDSYDGSPSGLDGDYEATVGGVVVDTWQATYTMDAATGIGTCNFTFNGTQGGDTVISITNTTASRHAMINGFMLTQFPGASGTVITVR